MIAALAAGTLFADRFVIEATAGRGATGVVHRARDLETGHLVALKLLDEAGPVLDLLRFGREAALLAGLDHPGIVRHVAHGVARDGRPYLAMEWLDGRSLAEHLAAARDGDGGGLGTAASLGLIRRLAEALASAHRQGIVHRDLKPGNVFLRDGRLDAPVILDFGLARTLSHAEPLTVTGALLGTPGYLAPEQAGGGAITASADVFALGCLLFEGLTGQPLFAGQHLLAMLAQLLLDEPPRLRTHLPAAAPALDELVARLVARDPAARPADADRLLAALAELDATDATGATDATIAAPPPAEPAGLARAEQRSVTIVLATHLPASTDGALAALVAALTRAGAAVALIGPTALCATVTLAHGAATDQAIRAARCALLLREHIPDAALALATGRATTGNALPVGEAVDRAWRLLQRDAAVLEPDAIVLDALTAGLLDGRFETPAGPGPDAWRLGPERGAFDPTRPLIGKPTPCVGREVDLAMLEYVLQASRDDERATAAVVTAPAGTGKSRLRHELLRRLRARGDDVTIALGAGDPLNAGAPYGVLGQAVRQLCGLDRTASADAQRAHLRARVADPAFLGELCGLHFDDADDPRLRAARQDPRIMRDHIADAFVALLARACAAQPVVLVLEDLHWGDALTVQLVELALRQLEAAPLCVLGFARPELHDLFPRLWPGRHTALALAPLGKKACERLIAHVLGARSDATVTRLVALSTGNALYLEELIRAAADGSSDAPPATVMAMLEARLQQLPADARRALRLAAIFGSSFDRAGVAALSGPDEASALDPALATLRAHEIIAATAGHPDRYTLRHALVRDAAYAMLTDGDRRLGHRRAARFLEATGPDDPLVLAEHHRLGGEPEAAAACYARATDLAIASNDLIAALAHTERGLACAPTDATRGVLQANRTRVHLWRADLVAAAAAGAEALPLLAPGSARWCQSAHALFLALSQLGDLPRFGALAQAFLTSTPEADAWPAYVEAATTLAVVFTLGGAQAPAGVALARGGQVVPATLAQARSASAWLRYGTALWTDLLAHDPWAAATAADAASLGFDDSGDRRMAACSRAIHAVCMLDVTGFAPAIACLRTTAALVRGLDETLMYIFIAIQLAQHLAERGDPAEVEEARAVATDLIAIADHLGAPRTMGAGAAHVALAHVHRRTGDLDAALRCARTGRDILAITPAMVGPGFVAEATVLRARGQHADARAVAEAGVALARAHGGLGRHQLALHLALAEACLAGGDPAAAATAIADGLAVLDQRAATLADPAHRAHYLTQVPDHVRLQTLAGRALDPRP